MKKPLIILLTLLIWVTAATGPVSATPVPGPAQQSGSGNTVFLPLVTNVNLDQYNVRVNTPYFSDDAAKHFSEAAVFWFGQVSPSTNYADIRFAYDNTKLWVYISTFDQYMWYPTNPTTSPLTSWDSATLQVNTGGNIGSTPSSKSYKFDAALSWYEDRPPYQVAYQWQNNQWVKANLPLNTIAGYDGFFNDNSKGTRGWAITFEVPFSSLGLSSRPVDGTIWGVSMTMHDRDSAAGPPLADSSWPAGFQPTTPATWAQLRFGLPNYGAVSGTASGSTVIRRETQNSSAVPDAGLGGTTSNLCPGDNTYIWNSWGNDNFGKTADFNIQNQSKITDWPCYSKYYVTFPLSAVPANKVILSAKLVLHYWGSAGEQGQATDSLIQVLTVGGDWAENTITWNNAPAPTENVAQSWVRVPSDFNYHQWPGLPQTWDVTTAASRAYITGQPLRLAMYEADTDYHSGKYFVSSDTGDWNIAGRPRLEIQWGNR
ncbi:MAG TPA: DNRLRE domain-containing protein [Anaerolinea sp.]|nr:DNRLRE domain-containing protein [Anaerolinea sp.]